MLSRGDLDRHEHSRPQRGSCDVSELTVAKSSALLEGGKPCSGILIKVVPSAVPETDTMYPVTSFTCGDASNPIVKMRKLRLRESRRFVQCQPVNMSPVKRDDQVPPGHKGRERHSDGIDGGVQQSW